MHDVVAAAAAAKPRVGLASPPEAAAFLSLSRGKIYTMIARGECPCRQFGRSVRIPWAWLLELANAEVTTEELKAAGLVGQSR